MGTPKLPETEPRMKNPLKDPRIQRIDEMVKRKPHITRISEWLWECRCLREKHNPLSLWVGLGATPREAYFFAVHGGVTA